MKLMKKVNVIFLICFVVLLLVSCNTNVSVILDTNDNLAGRLIGNGRYQNNQEVTIKAITYKGYRFDGWYENEVLLTSEENYTFVPKSQIVTYLAKFSKDEALEDFEFISNENTCTLVRMKDKTLKKVIINDYVTSIKKGIFDECDDLTIYISIKKEDIPWERNWNSNHPVYYYSEKKPEVTGNYWYYQDGTITHWFDSYQKLELAYRLLEDDTYEVVGIGTYELDKLVVPNIYNNKPVTSIGEKAFSGLDYITSLKIPNSITSIKDFAFQGCNSLKEIVVEKGNLVYDSRNSCNAIIETSTNTLVVGCQNTIIPNTVTCIGKWAFFACSELTSIVIPGGVKEISSYAFYCCQVLNDVEMSNGIIGIGEYAFADCNSLTSISLPDGLISLGHRAFFSCINLMKITIPNSIMNIESGAFESCNNLIYNSFDQAIYLGNEESPYVVLVKACKTDVTSCIINESTKIIYGEAFSSCVNLTKIKIPNSVIMIGELAFFFCKNLTKIVISENVIIVKWHAFLNCSNLIIYFEPSVNQNGWYENWNPDNRLVYYYSEKEPTISGNYWHYQGGVITHW